MNTSKTKRPRVISIKGTYDRVPAIVSLAESLNVGYQRAFTAYLQAKKYCKVFSDKTVLEKTESIILSPKRPFVNNI